MKTQNLMILLIFLFSHLIVKAFGILSRNDPEQEEVIVNFTGTVNSKTEPEEDEDIFNLIGTVLNDPIGEVRNQLKSAFNIDLEGVQLEIDDNTIKKIISYFVNPDNVRSLIQDVPLIDTEKLLVYIETGCKALLGLDDRKIDIQVPGIKYFQLGCESISSQERTKTKRLVWEFQQFAQNISANDDAFTEMRSLLSSDAELLEDRHLDDPNYALFEFPRIACELLSGVQLDQRKVEKYAPEINFLQSACKVLTKDDVEILDLRFPEDEDDQVKSDCDILCSSFWFIMLIVFVRQQ